MSIVITPQIQSVAPQGATTAPVVLQPGSVISARVQQVLTSDTVRIAIGSQSIDVQSQVPLQAGQVLQLAVSQSADGTVRLAVVSPQDGASASQAAANAPAAAATSDTVTLAPNAVASIAPQSTPAAAAPTTQLTVPEALAVSVAAQAAATQQASLAPLFANLAVASGLGNLPPQVQQAAAQLLAQRVSVDQGLTGNDIKQAFQSSGLFLEASLATGSPASGSPDMKAALIVLRQVLSNSLNGAAPPPQNVTAPAATSTPGTLSTAAALQQATTTTPSAAAPQGSATPAVTVTPPATATAQPITASVVTTQGTAAAVIIEPGAQPPVQVASPSISSAAPETIATGSLAPEVVASTVSPQGGAAATAADVLNLGIANQTILPPATAADAAARTAASAAALNLLQEAVQTNPLTPFNMLNTSGLVLENGQMMGLLPAVAGGARGATVDDGEFAHTNVPPPPIGGALPAAQPVLPATLVSNSSAESAMHRLLGDTDAAIARQTLLQVASLPDRVDAAGARVDAAAPRWNFEIPFATPQGTAMAQFEISRDGGGSNEAAAAKRVWRARFSLDVEPAGPVHALVSLSGDKTSVRMWAERPATAAQLRAGAAQLSQALSKAELHPGDIIIRDGAPPQSAPARAGHFLDRAL